MSLRGAQRRSNPARLPRAKRTPQSRASARLSEAAVVIARSAATKQSSSPLPARFAQYITLIARRPRPAQKNPALPLAVPAPSLVSIRIHPSAVSPTASPVLSAPADTAPTPADDLRSLLKRCSPPTYTAALNYRRTRDPAHLPAIVFGVIERFVERPLRPRLQMPAEEVRLTADLGLDSLTLTELVILIEETLQLTLAPEELPRLRTLADLHRFIAAKLPK